jgi:hypothetical protein
VIQRHDFARLLALQALNLPVTHSLGGVFTGMRIFSLTTRFTSKISQALSFSSSFAHIDLDPLLETPCV